MHHCLSYGPSAYFSFLHHTTDNNNMLDFLMSDAQLCARCICDQTSSASTSKEVTKLAKNVTVLIELIVVCASPKDISPFYTLLSNQRNSTKIMSRLDLGLWYTHICKNSIFAPKQNFFFHLKKKRATGIIIKCMTL